MAGKREKTYSCYDYSLLFLTLFLVCFGLIMIYSTSAYSAQVFRNGDSMFYLKRQGGSALLGIVAMLFISKVDYRILLKRIPVLNMKPVTVAYLGAIILQIAVFIPGLGVEYNGAKRWLKLGPVQFQPSDLSKVAVILFVSYIIYTAPKRMDKFAGFIRVALYMSPLVGLVLKENMSTAIVLCGIMVGICFVGSRKKWYYFVAAFFMVLGGAAFILFGEGFRMERIMIWLDVENHEKGFQILQGLYAIASGGLTGTGLGGSMQKLGYVPEAQNDMIFSIICEELGLFGAITVILLFVLLIWRLFIISINAPDMYGGLMCTGILVHIAVQVVINIAVVTNSIPSTGIPLPFISYGGTSVAVLLAEMGLALSVSNQIKYER
ncbi:FtsW/RodA/SpoVE family cell cycle protein [Acetivibrio ethanolgignens]|uniref:Probable peptidoglycan glycosyltransferase FtsW n=1 Tax=Acetivibrio ethanolgignens TaxID=290052 RepID=A0A0V8QDQ8_9FIRM|nr:putative peptidoglycan glycosyltransferase FtsW [Acetivibrio ethanolgignens]KSV58704.1 cell division protein [Acetivibrio ethanolgignens]